MKAHEAGGRARALVVAQSLLAALVLVEGCASETASLQVFAAAGTKPAIAELAERFREQTGATVGISYGGAGEVLARMMFAKLGDVYVAPEQRFMDRATEGGVVNAATIERIAYMVPVLAVQKGNPKHVTALSDLARPGIRVATTRPETTCLGEFAPELFRRTGLAEEIGRNVVTEAARPDLLVTWLTLDEVDAVITWHFYGTLAGGEIEVIPLPRELLPGIGEVQAAVTTYSQDGDLARSFVRYLSGTEGRAVFGKHGYLVGSEELENYWAADTGGAAGRGRAGRPRPSGTPVIDPSGSE